MAESIRKPLTENELKFLELWETKVLTHKYNINVADIDEAAKLIGFHKQGNCASCNRNAAIDLNNKYNQMKSAYVNYQKQIEEMKKKEFSDKVKAGINKKIKKDRVKNAKEFLENKSTIQDHNRKTPKGVDTKKTKKKEKGDDDSNYINTI